MAKKTNKTSHVMNLLTNGASAENGDHAEVSTESSASPSSAAGSQEKKGDVQSHTVTPTKVTVVDEGSRNDRLSQEILNKLSEELEEEEGMENQKTDNAVAEPTEAPAVQDGAEKTAPTEPAAQTEEPVSQAAATEKAAPTPTAPETATTPAAEAETSTASPEATTQASPSESIQLSGKTAHHAIMPSQTDGNLINGEYRFVNIMEHLMLRQDISSYLDQYNVCKCPRCMADVCALALTGLPPKYVVTNKDSLSPLISYYENRNKITMLTALIKACNKVRENPRHKRR